MRAVIPNDPVAPGQQPKYYPIEMCFILPDQRVSLDKIDKNLFARLLRVFFL